MSLTTSLLLILAFHCLLTIRPSFAQIIVDDEHCSSFHDSCGRSFSEKYCCADGNGGVYLFSCCNPYIGLIVGISVGVPVIVLIIVGVIILYCCCAYHQKQKMARLAMSYSRNRNRSRRTATNTEQAPPPYAPTDPHLDSELPAYTAVDPFSITVVEPPEVVAPPPPPPPPPAPTQGEENPTQEETDHLNEQISVAVLEDVPLLSDGEQ